jgi:Protein of unknown function (DUF3102)
MAKIKAKAAPPGDNKALAAISKKIHALEKNNLSNVLRIGGLLREASEQICGHGEYQDWLKREFGWSYQTALNYRNVYDFAAASSSRWRQTFSPRSVPEKPNGWVFGDLDDLNITLSALYLVAAMKGEDEQDSRLAIIEAAKKGRVTYRTAREIIEHDRAAAATTTITVMSTVVEPESKTVAFDVSYEDLKIEVPYRVSKSPDPIAKAATVEARCALRNAQQETPADDNVVAGECHYDELHDALRLLATIAETSAPIEPWVFPQIVADFGSELPRIIEMLQAAMADSPGAPSLGGLMMAADAAPELLQ